jgi:hypothetical protein
MTKKRILGCLRVPPVEYHCFRSTHLCIKTFVMWTFSRSQWLWRRSAAAWLLGPRVRIPWIFISCVYMLCSPMYVEASATGWLFVQRSPTVCLTLCVMTETPKGDLRSSWEPTGKWMNECMNVNCYSDCLDVVVPLEHVKTLSRS